MGRRAVFAQGSSHPPAVSLRHTPILNRPLVREARPSNYMSVYMGASLLPAPGVGFGVFARHFIPSGKCMIVLCVSVLNGCVRRCDSNGVRWAVIRPQLL